MQYVEIDGVPQGSTLVFLIYVNDTPNCSKKRSLFESLLMIQHYFILVKIQMNYRQFDATRISAFVRLLQSQ
jgi:hypothetical protein